MRWQLTDEAEGRLRLSRSYSPTIISVIRVHVVADRRHNTVAPRYNEDPVITRPRYNEQHLKAGRITVKYVEKNLAITNPAITKSPL